MFSSTLLFSHNPALVVLAALVCATSAYAGVTLLRHARRSVGSQRLLWVAVAAISVGFGVWATHFVAMMSFHTGFPVGYDVPLTVVSLAIAVLVVGFGLWWTTFDRHRSGLLLGGAIVGLGISAMHYAGMAALIVGGTIAWQPAVVGASILLGMVFSAAALHVAGSGRGAWGRVFGTALLTLAICSMHFTAMGAADFSQCFPIIGDGEAPAWLSVVIALVGIGILVLALGGVYLDLRERRRHDLETDRMRGLADAAVEGLVVIDGETIVTANASFRTLAAMVGEPQGTRLTDFISREQIALLAAAPNRPSEGELVAANRIRLPVELIMRPIDFAGRALQAIAIRDLSARKQAEQHIRFLAHHDALTGLPNRANFGRRLDEEFAHARRHGETFAILCLDLDRFKEVNDLFGHPAGDALLQRVSESLLRTLGDDGMAARLGGDEFAILLPDIGLPARAGRIAEAILDGFRASNQRHGNGPAISASVGIAVFPGDAESPEHLMSHADTALYRAKQDGRGVYRFFLAEMGAEVRERRMLEHDLRHAVSRGELRLVYQPQVDLKSSEVTGFEALIRWAHPVRGDVSPGRFIPVAEESGLILQIGEWVLRTACAEAARWTVPLTVAVNVSAVQLHAPNFARLIHEVLVQTGVNASRLEIEITETALIRDMMRAVNTLRQIKAMGVRIAMDDFGTGYSSLANLRAFPFDKIKVDQSFIRLVDENGQSAAIVRAVLGLGSGLDVPVVAEGVERPEELAFLEAEVCQAAQGYLLSHPREIEAFRYLVEGVSRRLLPAGGEVPRLRVVS